MTYSYPAIFENDANNPQIINVTFPDIYGAKTSGIGIIDAMEKASELLTQMLVFQSEQCAEPHSLDEANAAFPEKNILMSDVDI